MDRSEAEELLTREALLLDEQRYDEWLDLYTSDAVYWMPSWANDSETVTDPHRELSLIYLTRAGLEDYARRAKSGEAHAFLAVRTNRLVSNVRLGARLDDGWQVFAKWLMQEYRSGEQQIFGGSFEYCLRRVDGAWKIAFKKVILLNDWIRRGHLVLP